MHLARESENPAAYIQSAHSYVHQGLFDLSNTRPPVQLWGKFIEPGLPKHVKEPLAGNPGKFVTLEEGVPLQAAVGMSKQDAESSICLTVMAGCLSRSRAGRGGEAQELVAAVRESASRRQRGLLGMAAAVTSLTAKLVRP